MIKEGIAKHNRDMQIGIGLSETGRFIRFFIPSIKNLLGIACQSGITIVVPYGRYL